MERVVISQRKCPVCKNERCEECFSVGFGHNEYLPSEYKIVACKTCGFCFSDSSAKMEDYEKYYINCNTYSEEQKKLVWLETLYTETRNLLLQNVTLKAKILDMGFGKGELLCFLKENGFENLYGVDPSIESVQRIESFGINATVGGAYDEAKASYDVVMLFNVLEHLFEPGLAVERLGKRLTAGGFLVLAVPIYNRLSEDNTLLPNNFNREHINYFSANSIRGLVANYNFSEVGSTHIEIPLGQYGRNYIYLGIYKKVEEREEIDAVRDASDTETRDSIMEYYERLKRNLEQRLKKIDNLVKQNKPIVIWGAGENLSNLLTTTELGKCRILFLVDNNRTKIGKRIEGFPVKAPENLYEFDGIILICAMLGAEAINQQIKEMNLTNEVIIIN